MGVYKPTQVVSHTDYSRPLWPRRVVSDTSCLQLLDQQGRRPSSSIADTGKTVLPLLQGMNHMNDNPGSRHPRKKKAFVFFHKLNT